MSKVKDAGLNPMDSLLWDALCALAGFPDIDKREVQTRLEKRFGVHTPAPLDTKSTVHVDMAGSGPNCRCVVEPATHTLSRASYHKAMAAVATCEQLGYTHTGGVLWRPPLGPKPDFAAIDRDRTLLAELLRVIHRDGGETQKTHGSLTATRMAMRKVVDESTHDKTTLSNALDAWVRDFKASL